jgi:hypothetical protein
LAFEEPMGQKKLFRAAHCVDIWGVQSARKQSARVVQLRAGIGAGTRSARERRHQEGREEHAGRVRGTPAWAART